MKKHITWIWLLGMLTLSGCVGVPPQQTGVQQALHDQGFTYSLMALDANSYYLSANNKALYMDYVWAKEVKEANGAYHSMQLSTKENDIAYYVWIQADKYHGQVLKKVRYQSCDLMLDGSENFTSKQLCQGKEEDAARQYAKKIERYLQKYGITPQDAFTYGKLYLENNQAIAQWNYGLLKLFRPDEVQ